MAPVRPVLHRLSKSNETVRNAPKHEFWVEWSGSGAFLQKLPIQLRLANLCVMVLVRPIWHRVSCSNETVRSIPNYKFWVQSSGSGALVVKNSNAASFSELMRLWHQFVQFCIDFRAVTKRSKTLENMSFGSNGVDRVRSL
jgi:hypothetical protein